MPTMSITAVIVSTSVYSLRQMSDTALGERKKGHDGLLTPMYRGWLVRPKAKDRVHEHDVRRQFERYSSDARANGSERIKELNGSN